MKTAQSDSLSLNIATASAVAVASIVVPTTAEALDGAQALAIASDTAGFVHTAVVSGYAAAPALMLGLAFALAFPVLAVFLRITRWAGRPDEATRRYRRRHRRDVSGDISGDMQPSSTLAFLEVEGAAPRRFVIPRDMFRIGREDDNDIRIPSGAVHRYHAAIHREDYDGWHITDLSGVEGNGIVVNGRRCSDAALHDGDVIELGPGKLRFRAGFA